MAKDRVKQTAHAPDAPNDPVSVLRDLLLAPVPEETLLDLGRAFDTDVVLSGAKTFTASAAEIYGAFTPAQRAKVLGFSPPLLRLIDAEAQALRNVKVQHDAITGSGGVSRTKLRAAAREAAGAAVATRDQAAALLRRVSAGDGPALATIDATVGTAETPAKLVAGLRGVAVLVRAALAKATPARLEAYALVQFDEALAAGLGDAADAVQAAADAEEAPLPDDRVTQRALDVQDGRVLYLVKLTHDAFRHARNHDGTILLPDLGSAQRLYETRTREKAAPVATTTTTTTNTMG